MENRFVTKRSRGWTVRCRWPHLKQCWVIIFSKWGFNHTETIVTATVLYYRNIEVLFIYKWSTAYFTGPLTSRHCSESIARSHRPVIHAGDRTLLPRTKRAAAGQQQIESPIYNSSQLHPSRGTAALSVCREICCLVYKMNRQKRAWNASSLFDRVPKTQVYEGGEHDHIRCSSY